MAVSPPTEEENPTHAGTPDPRPMAGYAALLSTYGALFGSAAVLLWRSGRRHRPFRARELPLYALATMHLSRLIAKDAVFSPLRAPFTVFEEATGEGEVNERVIGSGLRHAVGELITCPFCLAQWVAVALVTGRAAAPELTDAFVSGCALARASDYLQLSYDWLKRNLT
jgi:hypothetical protein